MSSSSGLPPIRACLFDMDGLLINSEDLYTITINKILSEYGKPNIPWHIKAQLQGRPAPESGRIFQEWAQLPIPPEEFHAKNRALQLEHFPTCQPLPGAHALVSKLASTPPPKKVHIALATSSHNFNYELKTRHLQDLFTLFPPEHRIVGDDPRIPAGRGKPAPDIYLVALKAVNESVRAAGEPEIRPEECLVFEDSVPGVEAGRRAGMQVVWCPHPGLRELYMGREEEVLAGLTGEHVGEEGEDPPGAIGDGWGRLLGSLEEFDYGVYGIRVE
ncbi:HAD-like protein [Trichodelitschia bisporula]|uniref:HAD-like protein n=1 Tax=Trichodelitschia bisporula TaxID=703511 RepID=A0A6G1HZF5_9PEZI|nr:HAD-like protein [Trichodelitschia bisporula]